MRNLEVLKKQYNPEAIHDLRVAVKKLRAYLKLLHLVYPQKDLREDFQSTEELFSILGKQRDIGVGIMLLESLEKDHSTKFIIFKDHLNRALQLTTEWMQVALADYDEKEIKELTSQIEQQLKDTDQAQLLEKIEAVIEKEYKKTKKHAEHLDRDTHQVRKLYKDIFYQSELCGKDILPDGIPLKNIKKILDHLGEWQDHEMLSSKVRHFRKDFVPGSKIEFGLLKDLEASIRDKKENLLEKAGKLYENP